MSQVHPCDSYATYKDGCQYEGVAVALGRTYGSHTVYWTYCVWEPVQAVGERAGRWRRGVLRAYQAGQAT